VIVKSRDSRWFIETEFYAGSAANTSFPRQAGRQTMALMVVDNTVQLSIGIEHIDDILGDIEQALAAAK